MREKKRPSTINEQNGKRHVECMHTFTRKNWKINVGRVGLYFFYEFPLSLPFFVRVPPHCSGNNLPSSLLSVTFTHVGNPILIKQKICLCICNWCRGTWSLCTVHTRLFEMHSLNAAWNEKRVPQPCHAMPCRFGQNSFVSTLQTHHF